MVSAEFSLTVQKVPVGMFETVARSSRRQGYVTDETGAAIVVDGERASVVCRSTCRTPLPIPASPLIVWNFAKVQTVSLPGSNVIPVIVNPDNVPVEVEPVTQDAENQAPTRRLVILPPRSFLCWHIQPYDQLPIQRRFC